jgi:hypothetical protein
MHRAMGVSNVIASQRARNDAGGQHFLIQTIKQR